ncbi:MAG: hypothetical protein ABEJ31_13605 [Haloarculaceae archaeon]
MARGKDEDASQKDSLTDGLDRRSYLKMAATGVGAAALGPAAMARDAAAQDGNYRTIKVPAGSLKRISVGDGETFENVLIDITASGAGCQIAAKGKNWTIRNVGVKGQQEKAVTMLSPAVTRSGATGLIENLYMGDGVKPGVHGVGCWVDATGGDAHRGKLTFRNVHIGHFADNGIYASGPASQLGDNAGTTIIEDSFGRNNNIAQFRVAQQGDVVRNCVAVADKSKVPPISSSRTVRNARGIRAVDGNGSPCQVENCNVKSPWNALEAEQGSTMNAKDCQIDGPISGSVNKQNVGTNPDLTPPDGTPMSAEEAASGTSSGGSGSGSNGGSSGGSSSPDTTTLSISGGSPSNKVTYQLTVSDGVEKSTANGGTISSEDTIDGKAVTGLVAGGVDSYDFTGEITGLSIDGSATVTRDGQQIDPSQFPDPSSGGSSGSGDSGSSGSDGSSGSGSLSNTISISGPSGKSSAYSLIVSGDLEKSTANGASINDEDVANSVAAAGIVAGGVDSYDYSGDITEFYAASGVTVVVNGKQVDPSSLGGN